MPICSRIAPPILAGLIALGLTALWLPSARAANPPRIEYVLVLDAHGKPRTYFQPGAKVGFRVELYLTERSAAGAKTVWRAWIGKHTLLARTIHGRFHGPTRGNLFTQTETIKLSRHALAGAYTVRVSIAVRGRHLSRTAHFWVRG